MNDKQIKSLLIVLVVVCGIWFGQKFISKRNQAQISTEGKLDLPAQESEIKRIEINTSDTSVKMQKRDNIRFLETENSLGEDRAKESDVTSLLKILEPTNIKLVSTNSNKHEKLGLSSTSSGTVKFFTDVQSTEPKIVLLFSQSNPKLFRQNEMSNVHEWSTELSRIINQDQASWIAPTPTPSIQEATPSSI